MKRFIERFSPGRSPLLLILLITAFVSVTYAFTPADTTGTGGVPGPQDLIGVILTIAGPIVVYLVTKLVGWLKPRVSAVTITTIIIPILAVGVAFLGKWAGGTSPLWMQILINLAGVFQHEFTNNIQKASAVGSNTPLLSTLTASVTPQTDVKAGISVLLNNVSKALEATNGDRAQVQKVADQLSANNGKLVDAATVNTPAA